MSGNKIINLLNKFLSFRNVTEVPLSVVILLIFGIYITIPIWTDYYDLEHLFQAISVVIWTISIELSFRFLYGKRRYIAMGIAIFGLAFSVYRFIFLVAKDIPFIALPVIQNTTDTLVALTGILLIIYVLTNKHWNTIPKTILCSLTSFLIVSVIVSSFNMVIVALNVLFGLFEGNTLTNLMLTSVSLSYGSFLGIMFLTCWLTTTQKSDVVSEEPHPFWKWLALIMVVFAVINLFILLAYAVKITATGQWTSNLIGRYVLIFGTYSVLAYVLSYPSLENNKRLLRIYALLFVVTLLFGFQALYIRIDQYGLTIPRFFALVIWAWLLTLTVLVLIRVRVSHIKILEITTILLIISTIVFRMPVHRSLHTRLKNWFETFIVNKEKTPSEKDVMQLRSLMETICNYFGKIDTSYIPTTEETKELKEHLAKPIDETYQCWSKTQEAIEMLPTLTNKLDNDSSQPTATDVYYRYCTYKLISENNLIYTKFSATTTNAILIDYDMPHSIRATNTLSADSVHVKVSVDTNSMKVVLIILSSLSNELDRFVIELPEKGELVRECNISAIKEDSTIIIKGSKGGKLILKEFRFSFKSARSKNLDALNIRILGVALIKSG